MNLLKRSELRDGRVHTGVIGVPAGRLIMSLAALSAMGIGLLAWVVRVPCKAKQPSCVPNLPPTVGEDAADGRGDLSVPALPPPRPTLSTPADAHAQATMETLRQKLAAMAEELRKTREELIALRATSPVVRSAEDRAHSATTNPTLLSGHSRELLKAIVTTDDSIRSEILRRLGIEWTRADFQFTLGTLTTNDWRAVQEMQRILEQWARAEPADAAAWAESLSSDKPRYARALSTVATVWARHDPVEAANWLLRLPQSPERDTAMQRILGTVAATDPGKALALYEQWDEKRRLAFAGTLAAKWASKDPAGAAEWVTRLPEGRHKNYAIQQLAAQLAKADPLTALRWADGVSDEGVRLALFSSVAREWTAKDPAAASQWLEGLAPGRSRDMAIFHFAIELAKMNPSLAAQWAESIQDKTLSQSALYSVAWRWIQTDREGARRWLERSDIPEAIRRPLIIALNQSSVPAEVRSSQPISGETLRVISEGDEGHSTTIRLLP